MVGYVAVEMDERNERGGWGAENCDACTDDSPRGLDRDRDYGMKT